MTYSHALHLFFTRGKHCIENHMDHCARKSPVFCKKHGGFCAKVVRFSLSVGHFRSATRRPRNGRRRPHVRSAHDRRRDRQPYRDLRTSTAHTRRVHRESPAPPTPASDEGHTPRREANAGRRDGTGPPHSRPRHRALLRRGTAGGAQGRGVILRKREHANAALQHSEKGLSGHRPKRAYFRQMDDMRENKGEGLCLTQPPPFAPHSRYCGRTHKKNDRSA